jgi:HMG (high mobility group) box
VPSPHCASRSHLTHSSIAVRLTWTDPVKSLAAPQQIAFAPAVTPGTFAEEPPVDGTDSSPSLFPSTQDNAGPRKPGHGKKKADDYIPRPPNAFILFRSSFIKSRHVSTEVETNHSTLSKIIGLTWQNMPHEERQFWHTKAKVAQAEHKRKFPDYAFRPSHMKSKCAAEKRKVREVGPKDMKRCAKIAQFLVEGKKGADLQAAVEEFDKSHIPTVVTRFDTPITARSFRRSLSEPAPDTDPSAPAFLRTDPRPSSRHLRATSSQPTLSRPSTPTEAEESVIGSSPSSVFCSSPFANIVDTPADGVWNDMPPLVLPPVGSTDAAFVTKPSLVSYCGSLHVTCDG